MTSTARDDFKFYKVETGREVQIPVYTGSGLHAGFPSPAMDYLQETIDLNTLLIRNPSATFIIDVTGDSMVDAGISNPARLVVDRSETLCNNDVVVAVVNNEFMLRRYVKEQGAILLKAENRIKAYPVTKIDAGMDFEIWGVVIHAIANLREIHFHDRTR